MYLYCGSSPFPKRYFEISSQMTTKIFFTSTQKRWPWEKMWAGFTWQNIAMRWKLSSAIVQSNATEGENPATHSSWLSIRWSRKFFLSQVQLLSRRRSNCVANFMSRHKNTNFAQNPDRCSTPIKKKKLVFSFFWSFTLERDIAHHVFVQQSSPFKPFFCLKQQRLNFSIQCFFWVN